MKPLTLLGIALLVFGFLSIIISVLSLSLQPSQEGGSSFAGCIIIFFIPICFGSGNFSPTLLEIFAVVTLIVFVAFFFFVLYINKKAVEEFR